MEPSKEFGEKGEKNGEKELNSSLATVTAVRNKCSALIQGSVYIQQQHTHTHTHT